MQLGGDPVAIL